MEFKSISALKYCKPDRGDVDAMKVLVENGIDCSIRNIDYRTVPHTHKKLNDMSFKTLSFSRNELRIIISNPLHDGIKSNLIDSSASL